MLKKFLLLFFFAIFLLGCVAVDSQGSQKDAVQEALTFSSLEVAGAEWTFKNYTSRGRIPAVLGAGEEVNRIVAPVEIVMRTNRSDLFYKICGVAYENAILSLASGEVTPGENSTDLLLDYYGSNYDDYAGLNLSVKLLSPGETVVVLPVSLSSDFEPRKPKVCFSLSADFEQNSSSLLCKIVNISAPKIDFEITPNPVFTAAVNGISNPVPAEFKIKNTGELGFRIEYETVSVGVDGIVLGNGGFVCRGRDYPDVPSRCFSFVLYPGQTVTAEYQVFTNRGKVSPGTYYSSAYLFGLSDFRVPGARYKKEFRIKTVVKDMLIIG
ncbi:hypothetical protein HZC09_02630 [Candidatus Micrarchaeota archaeon]|nr:hypothetical protein [Candidatus Micrarchaeota archaeon]